MVIWQNPSTFPCNLSSLPNMTREGFTPPIHPPLPNKRRESDPSLPQGRDGGWDESSLPPIFHTPYQTSTKRKWPYVS